MNLDDESFLSAYLDDELDPADRLAVEWAVEASPALAEEIRALRASRDLVARLPRPPAPIDLGARVVAARRRARPRSIAAPASWVAAAACLAAMVSSLLFAVVLVYRTTHEPELPMVVVLSGPEPAPPVVPVRPVSPQVVVAGLPRSRPEKVPAPVVKPRSSGRLAREAREREERARIAGMLNGRKVLTAAIVTDVIDASEQVHSMLQGDARRNPEFGRVTIYQGIVVDPEHPEEADVFPVVIDEIGSGPFLDRLRKKFPTLVVNEQTNPEILTQLPEVGHVAFYKGVVAAPLGDPPRELGPMIQTMRDPPGDELVAESALVTSGDDEVEPPTVAAKQAPGVVSKRSPTVARSDKPSHPDSSPIPGDSVTILVWVTRPTRH